MARILIVDDREDSRELIGDILTEASHEVLFAADGVDGLTLYRRERPDVIVVDIFLPGMDGLLVIGQVRESFPEAKILAISGGLVIGGGDLLELAPKHGADAVLRKPFEAAVLVDQIARLLAKR